jgi:hypothetical protein
MKLTKAFLGLMALLLVIGVLAGCTGSSPQQGAPSQGAQTTAPTTPAAGGAGSTPGGGSTPASAGQILGALNYQWVEYKVTSGGGGQQVTMYLRFDMQKGTCTMRFEDQNIPGMSGQEMSCSSSGGQGANNPNQVSQSSSWTFVGTESVTVPAGTFTASKYTSAIQGGTGTYWIVQGTPMVKMVSSTAQGSSTMEMNGWG